MKYKTQLTRLEPYLKINFKQLIHEKQHAPLFGIFNACSAVIRKERNKKPTSTESCKKIMTLPLW